MFRKASGHHTLESPQRRATPTMEENSFTAPLEYAAALQEKFNSQDKCIIDLEVIMDGQTLFTDTTDYVARIVSTGASKKLTKIWAMMK